MCLEKYTTLTVQVEDVGEQGPKPITRFFFFELVPVVGPKDNSPMNSRGPSSHSAVCQNSFQTPLGVFCFLSFFSRDKPKLNPWSL